MGPLTPHCSLCLGKAVWSFTSRQQSTAAPWNPAWLWGCPSQWCHCQGEGLGSPGDRQTTGTSPTGAGRILTLAHSSPDMAHHRQAGKKKPSVDQHSEQDLQKGKCQEGEVKFLFHHIQIQFFLSSLKAPQALDGTERVDGEEHTEFPVTPTHYFIFFGLSNISALD